MPHAHLLRSVPCLAGLLAVSMACATPVLAADLVLGADDIGTGASHMVLSLGAPASAIHPASAAGFDPHALDSAVATPQEDAPGGELLQSGIASYYGQAWKGRRTASGTRYNPEAMTAASHTLPLGTRVLVTLEGTARSVLVTITDRQGTAARVIDLSVAAARKLGLLVRGTGRVTLRRA